jgi:hypothetical protein
MTTTYTGAQALTRELLLWAKHKDPGTAIPALIVAAAKLAAKENQSDEHLESLRRILIACFEEEREKYDP